MMGDIYIAAHLRRYLRHSVIGHVLQHTPSTSVLDALHLHHAVKSPPLRHPSPSHRAFIEAKNEPVKTKHVFQMKENTHTTRHQKKKTDIDTPTIMYQAKFAAIDIETIMYPVNFAGRHIETIMYQANFAAPGRGLDLLLPSFLPSREEKKKQERRKQSIDSGAEWHTPHTDRVRIETKMQEQKNHPSDSGAEWHTPHMDRVRIETKKQERIFCPLRGHAVGRMQYAPTSCRQETLFPINSREERIETKIQEQKNRPLGSRGVLHTPPKYLGRDEQKMQERRKQSIDSGAEWHTPFMRHGERDAVWRDTFLEQRARVAIRQDRRLEKRSSHARLQLRISRENSNPYKYSLVALSEQLRDIFAA